MLEQIGTLLALLLLALPQVHESGALVISAMLDFLTFALCAPYSETTDGTQFDMLLEMVAANGRIIFKLFQVGVQIWVWFEILRLMLFCLPIKIVLLWQLTRLGGRYWNSMLIL